MSKIDIKAQRIKSHYVGEDGIQIMIPYVKGLTIFDGLGILYHQYEGSDIYTNKYIEDNRRFNFPYSNIPVHYFKSHRYKFTMVNQLFDFDTPYIAIGNGGVVEYYVLKENDGALFVKRYVDLSDISSRTQTRKEIEDMVKEKDNEQKYIVGLDGGLATVDIPLDSEEDIHCYIKEKIENYMNYSYDPYDENLKLQLARKNIENNDFGNIMNVNLLNGFVVRINNINGMELKYLNIDYVADDCYKVVEEDIPIKKYNLEMVKCLVKKITETKEPRISLFQNPNISRKDIKEAKQKVKELKK